MGPIKCMEEFDPVFFQETFRFTSEDDTVELMTTDSAEVLTGDSTELLTAP